MGYVGGSIPGHSGTQQKHKKAFAQRRAWGGDWLSLSTGESKKGKVTGKYTSQYGNSEIVRGINVSLGIAAFVIGCWWFYNVVNTFYDEPGTTVASPQVFTPEDKHAYHFLVDNAHGSLAGKDYRLAIYEFQSALKIAPYGKEARLGLLKAMQERCLKLDEYCDEIAEQAAFVEGMGWLEDGDTAD